MSVNEVPQVSPDAPVASDQRRDDGPVTPPTGDEIRINPEFERVVPPASEEELGYLEASLREDGCLSPLVVQQGTRHLLDGHQRYRLCRRHDIPVTTVAVDVPSPRPSPASFFHLRAASGASRRKGVPQGRLSDRDPVLREVFDGQEVVRRQPDLEQLFAAHGTVQSAQVIMDRRPAGPRASASWRWAATRRPRSPSPPSTARWSRQERQRCPAQGRPRRSACREGEEKMAVGHGCGGCYGVARPLSPSFHSAGRSSIMGGSRAFTRGRNGRRPAAPSRLLGAACTTHSPSRSTRFPAGTT
jgi:hypothetical protein